MGGVQGEKKEKGLVSLAQGKFPLPRFSRHNSNNRNTGKIMPLNCVCKAADGSCSSKDLEVTCGVGLGDVSIPDWYGGRVGWQLHSEEYCR